MTKLQAIKEIEKLTGLHTFDGEPVYMTADGWSKKPGRGTSTLIYDFTDKKDVNQNEKYKKFSIYATYTSTKQIKNIRFAYSEVEHRKVNIFEPIYHSMYMPIEWLEPLSRLIPILFKEGE